MASLVKSPSMTPEKLAANQANGRQSQGPATPEGLERSADSKIRHGFYSERSGEALRALGEDPEELEKLLESLRATWQPSDGFQSRLVERLGRAIWRLERSDRVQESIAVKQVREINRELDRLIDKSLQAYDKKLAALDELAEAVRDEQFVADRNVFIAFDTAFGEQLEGRGGEILSLLYQLLDPEGSDPDAPAPDPEHPIATGADRAEGREMLGSLVREEIEAVTQARKQDRESRLDRNAPYFRDSAIPPSAQRAGAVFRMEETSFR
ncbi:MAG TPA: hypothetical protein VMT20_19960 [Terriglobia bacterium]|nr:hypothetical protein [Terriglobia bacterium]